VTTPALSRALNDLAGWNSTIMLENTNIRVVYRCPPSAFAAVRSAIAVLREHKAEAITLLTEKLKEKPRGDSQNWSLQGQEETEKFANPKSVDAVLTQGFAAPPMPPGIRIVHWNPKEPPIAIDSCTVVADVALFIKTTLEQLTTALTDQKRWVGWSLPQLADRLRQAGVVIELGK
jgi:hypothetical protein